MDVVWKALSRKCVFNCPIFSLNELSSRSPDGKQIGTFIVMESSDWVIVIPCMGDDSFVMVRQWRHGSQQLSLEFPGGVCNKGEAPEQAALRELKEETGYQAKKITKLGMFNPNPAIQSNHVHIFLAEALEDTRRQTLDADEFLNVETVPVDAVIHGMGKGESLHALMGSALLLYLRFKRETAVGWNQA
ncbi:MAG: NUDIX hydrolase [Treponema sp.]|nr:NUDIX hydrolase [Treponema sp.]